MEIPSVIQPTLDLVFFIIRILVPCISLGILITCFISHRIGRRKEEPVVFLEVLGTDRTIPVLYWENSLGRSKSCDIPLKDGTVSRDHAVLMRRSTGWVVADSNSKGGVYVNGKPIAKEAPVRPNDIITLGNTHLRLKRVTDVEVPGELFSDYDRHTAMQQRPARRIPHPAVLLWGVTLIQILLTAQLVAGTGKIVFAPLITFGVLFVYTWGFYLFSRKALGRVSFEIETIGLWLSSIGLLLLTGKEMEPNYTAIIGLGLGIVFFCFLIWFMRDLERVMKWRMYIAIAAILFFVINLVFGTVQNGSRNWIYLGSFSIQPSEFIKIAFIFVGASTLNKLQTTRNLAAFLIFSGLCMVALFLMKDFGTACIFFVTFLIIAFMRSGSLRTIFLILGAACLGAFLALTFIPYIADRFSTWGHVWEYADTSGWQQANALMYAASGGLFGLGLGNGYNISTNFAGDSDVVFASICEEMGLVMGVLILLSLAMLILLSRSDVTRSRSTFYSICGCAASGLFLFQGILNVFGTVDIFPLTGVTLPFISAGGSSLVAVWGLLSFCKAADERTYAAHRGRYRKETAQPMEDFYPGNPNASSVRRIQPIPDPAPVKQGGVMR